VLFTKNNSEKERPPCIVVKGIHKTVTFGFSKSIASDIKCKEISPGSYNVFISILSIDICPHLIQES
jgi:hypothetical protein